MAGAFAALPEQEQQILILHCVAAMSDGEIGGLVGMSRSAVPASPHKDLERITAKIGGRRREETDMKQPTFHGRVLLPLSVFADARAGDPLEMERILRYYDSYINKLCTRTLYELDGTPLVRVDEYMKHRLQNKLIRAILKDSL